jgi:hypothetical protein
MLLLALNHYVLDYTEKKSDYHMPFGLNFVMMAGSGMKDSVSKQIQTFLQCETTRWHQMIV